jgi:hypothetical protein
VLISPDGDRVTELAEPGTLRGMQLLAVAL